MQWITPRIRPDRAALVELANAPDVFRAHAEHALGRELVPGEVRLVLSPPDEGLWMKHW